MSIDWDDFFSPERCAEREALRGLRYTPDHEDSLDQIQAARAAREAREEADRG